MGKEHDHVVVVLDDLRTVARRFEAVGETLRQRAAHPALRTADDALVGTAVSAALRHADARVAATLGALAEAMTGLGSLTAECAAAYARCDTEVAAELARLAGASDMPQTCRT